MTTVTPLPQTIPHESIANAGVGLQELRFRYGALFSQAQTSNPEIKREENVGWRVIDCAAPGPLGLLATNRLDADVKRREPPLEFPGLSCDNNFKGINPEEHLIPLRRQLRSRREYCF